MQLEDEMAQMKINMESAHQNELDALNRKITELNAIIDNLKGVLEREVGSKDELIAQLQAENKDYR